MAILNNGRFGMGAALTSTMKALMARAAEHANSRKQFGGLIRDYGLIREKFAQMAIKAYVAESMAYLVGHEASRWGGAASQRGSSSAHKCKARWGARHGRR